MTNKRCFVQFTHPGTEHDAMSGKVWHKNVKNSNHRRKFMQFPGEWMEKRQGRKKTGELQAWGEWEPDSTLLREFQNSGTSNGSPFPSCVWRPHYTIPSNGYQDLHNTDPFIFGESFLYSNCKQRRENSTNNPTKMQKLDIGSVIVFGSSKKDLAGHMRWMLDTVFVVSDFVDYDPTTMCMKQADEWRDLRFDDDWKPSKAFRDVVGGPFGYKQESSNPRSGRAESMYRLYRGATPDNPVHEMFSFFPAMPAEVDRGFARPYIDLDNTERLNPKLKQGLKGVEDALTIEELQELWNGIVNCVLQNKLVLGTHGTLPKRRST